jgi:type IV pilus assembly protein PilB
MDKELLHKALVETGTVNESQFKKIQEESESTGVELENILVNHGLVGKEELYQAVAKRINVPYIDPSSYVVDPEILALIPEKFAREHQVVPLFRVANSITIAMVNPQNIGSIDELSLFTGLEISPVLAPADSIAKALDRFYGGKKTDETLADTITVIDQEALPSELRETSLEEKKNLEELAAEAPIVKFVNQIVHQALKERASDIHFEPEEKTLRIRLRVDGMLRIITEAPVTMKTAVVSRIKILAKLNIAEKRKPQDGQFEMLVDNKKIDFRVSTFPTVYGEAAVLRILDKSSIMVGMSDLGFSVENLIKFSALIRSPYGIILVTGPTGSGKTTTLYAALDAVRSEEKNIMTLEDPVEYHLPLIRQSQINLKAQLTFATGLRSILRQDPDIIMVGEIRDAETAEIAVQAALTGHLVLSTLHTNNACGSLTRLMDMGAEPFLVASTVIGVLAQRLVRRICDSCKEPYQTMAQLSSHLNLDKDTKLFKGKGCSECNNTGYRGRVALYELLVVDNNVRKMIIEKNTSEDIQKYLITKGFKTMRDDGLEKVRKGVTTLEEVLRITHGN